MKTFQLIFATAVFIFAAQLTFANGPADPEAKDSKKTTTFVETVNKTNQTIYRFQTPELSLQTIQNLTDISNLIFLVANPDVNGFNYNPETNSFNIDCKPDANLDTDEVSKKLTALITL